MCCKSDNKAMDGQARFLNRSVLWLFIENVPSKSGADVRNDSSTSGLYGETLLRSVISQSASVPCLGWALENGRCPKLRNSCGTGLALPKPRGHDRARAVGAASHAIPPRQAAPQPSKENGFVSACRSAVHPQVRSGIHMPARCARSRHCGIGCRDERPPESANACGARPCLEPSLAPRIGSPPVFRLQHAQATFMMTAKYLGLSIDQYFTTTPGHQT